MEDNDNDRPTVDGIPLAAGVSPNERWIDAHSVTCPLCGGYADETQTIDLWRREEYPDGEAHPGCYQYAEAHGVERATRELEPLVTPT
jgi:hypothetical protein